MKYLFLIPLIFFSGFLTGQTRADNKLIVIAIRDYTSKWETKINPRYLNRNLQSELELLHRVYNQEYIKDSAHLKYKQLLLNDTIVIEGYYFPYLLTKKIAERKYNGRISNLNNQYKVKGKKLNLSVPIYSYDNKIALVYVQTICGPLCGSVEILILEKVQNTWQIKDRRLRSIS